MGRDHRFRRRKNPRQIPSIGSRRFSKPRRQLAGDRRSRRPHDAANVTSGASLGGAYGMICDGTAPVRSLVFGEEPE